MSAARDAILGRIRERLGRSRALEGGLPGPAPRSDAAPAAARPASEAELVEAFVARLEPLGAEIVHAEADLGAGLERALEGASSVAWSDAPELAPFRERIRALGLRDVDPADRAALLACDAGVTTAQWGIAETGSLVLVSRDERHRLASLVPPTHVCVLPARRLVPRLGHALARIAGGDAGPSPLVTFVTGPSRTADIELTLVVGVHGPRRLRVILG